MEHEVICSLEGTNQICKCKAGYNFQFIDGQKIDKKYINSEINGCGASDYSKSGAPDFVSKPFRYINDKIPIPDELNKCCDLHDLCLTGIEGNVKNITKSKFYKDRYSSNMCARHLYMCTVHSYDTLRHF